MADHGKAMRTRIEMAEDVTADCPVCASGQTRCLRAQPVDYEYGVQPCPRLAAHHCESCGSQFLHPRPTVEKLATFYPPDYHAYNEDHGVVARALVSWRGRYRARNYRRLVSRRPVLLFDVGAGDCRHFEDLARHGGFEFAGVEINPAMTEAARRRGYDVRTGTLEEMDVSSSEGRFDLVTMYQLVEHVIEPAVLFERAFRLLRPGGFVLGQLPSMDSLERPLFGRYWAGYHYPRHLQMLTKRGLNELIRRAGFADVHVRGALHLQAGLSLQNWLVGGLGYRPKLTYGKAPIYSLLLLVVVPFCFLEYLCGRAGMMNFIARRPVAGEEE